MDDQKARLHSTLKCAIIARMSERIKFTEELGEEICCRIVEGETLKSICQDEHMPRLADCYVWNRGGYGAPQAYVNAYARSRLDSAHTYGDEIIEISDSSDEEINQAVENKETKVLLETGSSRLAKIAGFKQRRESIDSRKMRISTREWLMARINRSAYGDKIAITDETPSTQVRKTVDLEKCSVEQLEAIARLSGELPSVDTEQ